MRDKCGMGLFLFGREVKAYPEPVAPPAGEAERIPRTTAQRELLERELVSWERPEHKRKINWNERAAKEQIRNHKGDSAGKIVDGNNGENSKKRSVHYLSETFSSEYGYGSWRKPDTRAAECK